MSEQLQLTWIAGFWRRIAALLLDMTILAVIGYTLGLIFEAAFVQLGGWGRCIGFSVGLLYFSVMNSSLCRGQTPGKKLLGLRVVNSDNQSISVGRSLLRYCILSAPFMLNGAQFSNEAMLSFLVYPLAIVIFGGGLSLLYLYLFNRVSRQSLHDVLVGTYVVHADAEQSAPGKVWKSHLVVVVILFIAAAVTPIFTSKLTQSAPFDDLLATQSALLQQPGITYASVFTNTSISTLGDEPAQQSSFVSVQALLSDNSISDAELARNLALVVIQHYPDVRGSTMLRITLTYGYDIAIWSEWSSYTYEFNPAEFSSPQ